MRESRWNEGNGNKGGVINEMKCNKSAHTIQIKHESKNEDKK